MDDNLVSIVMPAYNAAKFISASIESVLNQSYQSWELLIVDDCSKDSTREIIESYTQKDKRIRYYRIDENSGAAIARKTGIEAARGKYIAFLDSDDIWLPEKLTKQVNYMLNNKFSFTCTIYGKINEEGQVLNDVVEDQAVRNYKDLLKSCPGNSTVIYDAEQIGKISPINIKKRNDYVLWLDVIKVSKFLYCFPELLGYHRLTPNSISSKKLQLIKYHWYIYRKKENLSFIYSSYLIIYWCLKGVLKMFKRD